MEDPYDAAKDADALVIITEWNEYRGLDLKRIASSMKEKVLVDLRNIYKVAEVEPHGFEYVSIGRPALTASGQKKLRAV